MNIYIPIGVLWAIASVLLVSGISATGFNYGYSLGVKDTEKRWSEAVSRIKDGIRSLDV